MSQQLPNRIETQVTVDSRVKPTGITLGLRIVGSATVGSVAAVRKNKELLAIQELMSGLGVAEEKVQIESVTFEAGERWLSGSSAEITLLIRDIPLRALPEALGALSAMKGVSLTDVRREYGDLSAERDELLRRAVTESMRQAKLIATTAGLPVRSIYSMAQKWTEPMDTAMAERYDPSLGMKMSKRAGSDDVKGYQLLEHHEGRLALHLRVDVTVGDFSDQS